jgi:sugar phosphate isomerase/epimerase
MHLGIFAKTFPRPALEETLDAIARALTHVQFNMSCVGLPTLPERIDEDYCRAIAQSFRERGLTMAAISGTFNLCDPDAIRLLDNLKRLDVLAAACRWLDTRIITLCTGTRDPQDMWRWHPENVRRSTWDTMIGSMRLAVQIADRHEVTLAFEPELNNVVNSVSKARRLLDEIGSPWLKVVIDPANLIRPGELPRMAEVFDEAFDWLGPDIVLAHAKDPHIDEASDSAELHRLVTSYAREHGPEALLHLKVVMGFTVGAPIRFPEGSDFRKWLRDPGAVPHWSFSECREFFRFFFFYQPYLNRLAQIGYSGAIVMHGLEESDVVQRTSFLQKILDSRSITG